MADKVRQDLYFPSFDPQYVYLQSLSNDNAELYRAARSYLGQAFGSFVSDIQANANIKMLELTSVMLRLISGLRAREQSALASLKIMPQISAQGKAADTLVALLNAESNIQAGNISIDGATATLRRQEAFSKYFLDIINRKLFAETRQIEKFFKDGVIQEEKFQEMIERYATEAVILAMDTYNGEVDDNVLPSVVNNIMTQAGLKRTGKFYKDIINLMSKNLKRKTRSIEKVKKVKNSGVYGMVLEGQTALDLSRITDNIAAAIGGTGRNARGEQAVTDVYIPAQLRISYSDDPLVQSFYDAINHTALETRDEMLQQMKDERERVFNIHASVKDIQDAFKTKSKDVRLKNQHPNALADSFVRAGLISAAKTGLVYILKNSVSGAIGDESILKATIDAIRQFCGILIFDDFEKEFNLPGTENMSAGIYIFQISGQYYSYADILEDTLKEIQSSSFDNFVGNIVVDVDYQDATNTNNLYQMATNPRSEDDWSQVSGYVEGNVDIYTHLRRAF